MSSAHPLRSTGRLIAVVLVSSLAVAACGGKDEKKQDDGAAPTPTSTATQTPAEPLLSPLTGEQVASEPKHPIVIVKIDNSHASAPQIGLGSADLVTEELVEGGITRLAVFFDQKIPKNVGPVRSMRATDIGVIQPAKAVLVASGGARQTVDRVRKAKITMFTEGAKGFYREGTRRAPYNLMMHLSDLVKSVKKGERVHTYLPFAADDSAFPKGKRATALDARFSGRSVTHWEFQNGRYVNTNSNAAQGDRFEPATVLVLRVRVGDAGYRDPAGNPVPETFFTGEGAAIVFHGGRMVRATWNKADFDSELTLTARGGDLKLPPGKVWIELVPAQGGSVTVKR